MKVTTKDYDVSDKGRIQLTGLPITIPHRGGHEHRTSDDCCRA